MTYLNVRICNGKFQLNERTRTLLKLKTQTRVKIDAKPFDAICFFARYPGQVFSHHQLISLHDNDWSGTVSQEQKRVTHAERNRLYKVINLVNGALKHERPVKSVRARGYRFDADVVQVKADLVPGDESLSKLGQHVRHRVVSDKRNLPALRGSHEVPRNLRMSENLEKVVAEYLQDLEYASRKYTGKIRFISTNTTLAVCGVELWHIESAVHRMMIETEKILANSRSGFECWRIFFHSRKEAIAFSELEKLFYILYQHRKVGIRVALASYERLLPTFPPQFSEFHCVPGNKLFISVPPYHLTTVIEGNSKLDKRVIEGYSELASSTVLKSIEAPDQHAFEWTGESVHDLALALGRQYPWF